jgi:phenylalanyl-tRNA synthetase beta chain
MNMGFDWKIKAITHPSFIDGRIGEAIADGVPVGFLGEINPQVLMMWKLENPIVAFELNVQKILASKLL